MFNISCLTGFECPHCGTENVESSIKESVDDIVMVCICCKGMFYGSVKEVLCYVTNTDKKDLNNE